ncbi:hypothetical protein FACS189467_8410 [Bacteroidia bacterium]|nr:hypothetical protein FACS189467_8410 [Bacteroidia bacterium]
MAIFGAGSFWDNREEQKDKFFKENKFIMGWDENSAENLYAIIASLKVGDIIYLKSNQPGSHTIRVKGIGIVIKNVLQCMKEYGYMKDYRVYVKVKWVNKNEFPIEIKDNDGKLTNVRAASFYEEFLPSVQKEIVKRRHCKCRRTLMQFNNRQGYCRLICFCG